MNHQQQVQKLSVLFCTTTNKITSVIWFLYPFIIFTFNKLFDYPNYQWLLNNYLAWTFSIFKVYREKETRLAMELDRRRSRCLVGLAVRPDRRPIYRSRSGRYRHRSQLDDRLEVRHMPASVLAEPGAVLLVLQWDQLRSWQLFAGKASSSIHLSYDNDHFHWQ